jgi:hypothetical protein
VIKSLQDRIQLLEDIVFNNKDSLLKRVERLEEAVLSADLQKQKIEKDNKNLIHRYTFNTCLITMFVSLALGVLINVLLIHKENVKDPKVKKEILAKSKALSSFNNRYIPHNR